MTRLCGDVGLDQQQQVVACNRVPAAMQHGQGKDQGQVWAAAGRPLRDGPTPKQAGQGCRPPAPAPAPARHPLRQQNPAEPLRHALANGGMRAHMHTHTRGHTHTHTHTHAQLAPSRRPARCRSSFPRFPARPVPYRRTCTAWPGRRATGALAEWTAQPAPALAPAPAPALPAGDVWRRQPSSRFQPLPPLPSPRAGPRAGQRWPAVVRTGCTRRSRLPAPRGPGDAEAAAAVWRPGQLGAARCGRGGRGVGGGNCRAGPSECSAVAGRQAIWGQSGPGGEAG